VDISSEDEGEEEGDEDETARSPKRRRLDTYKCAHCGDARARFLAPLIPMCSRQCVRDYFYG
jgi:ribosomal protein S14